MTKPQFTFTTVPTTPEERVALVQRIVGYLHDALDAFAHSEAQRQGYSADQRLWPVEEMLVAMGAVMFNVARTCDAHSAAQRVAKTLLQELDPIADPTPTNTTRH